MGGYLRIGWVNSILSVQKIQTGVGSAKSELVSFSSLRTALTSFTHEGDGRPDLWAWQSGILMKHPGSEICLSGSFVYSVIEEVIAEP